MSVESCCYLVKVQRYCNFANFRALLPWAFLSIYLESVRSCQINIENVFFKSINLPNNNIMHRFDILKSIICICSIG